jgi:hypothetical protein
VSSIPRQLAAFAIVLAVLFGAGAIAGQLIDPEAPGGEAEAHNRATSPEGMNAMNTTSEAPGGAHGEMAADPVRGLAVAQHGLRVVVNDPELRRGGTETLRFRVVDDGGGTVRDFDVEHTKRMHLIVARRDLTGFQHLHPTMSADGTWTTPLRLADAGSYRIFADFSHDGEATTLAADLRVDGAADLRPLPAPRPAAASDGGYEVRLDSGAARAGEGAELRFTVSKDGRAVETEPYLGAGGHLVALREGDLAFLHVHPTDATGDTIGFEATFPTTGSYRLFLQFKVAGTVQTAAFTEAVE